MQLESEKRRLFIPLLLPAVLLYVAFTIVPLIQAFPMSLTDYDGFSLRWRFVGLGNFQELLSDPRFRADFIITLKFAAIGVISIPLQLFFAVVLTQKIPLRRTLRGILFVPSLLSVVVTGMLWSFVYNPYFGVLSETLRAIGLGDLTRMWLGDKATAIPAVAAMGIWQSVGVGMLIFLAGLRKIPKDLYDAALVDGAGTWQSFRYITWPLIWEITRILIILYVIGGLQYLGPVLVMTWGGPVGATETIGMYMYITAFQFHGPLRFGYVVAMGILVFVWVLFATVLVSRLTRMETYEY